MKKLFKVISVMLLVLILGGIIFSLYSGLRTYNQGKKLEETLSQYNEE